MNRLSIYISTEYEGYIGKELLSLEKLERMEEMMHAGLAKTIAEVVALQSKM